MEDPWKWIAFPISAVTGYLISLGAASELSQIILMPEFTTNLIVIGTTAFLVGFLIDEVIPAYIEKVRNRSGSGGAGLDSGGDDLDFE